MFIQWIRMMKTVDYIILQTKTRKGMREKVSKLIEDGWELQGGIAKDGDLYMQALIKRI